MENFKSAPQSCHEIQKTVILTTGTECSWKIFSYYLAKTREVKLEAISLFFSLSFRAAADYWNPLFEEFLADHSIPQSCPSD